MGRSWDEEGSLVDQMIDQVFDGLIPWMGGWIEGPNYSWTSS